MADADGWLIEEWTALAVLLAVHAGELVLAQSGRPIRIRTKVSGRDLVSDTGLAACLCADGLIDVRHDARRRQEPLARPGRSSATSGLRQPCGAASR